MLRRLQEELTQPMIVHPDCALVEAPFASAYRRLAPEQAFVFREAAMTDGTEISVRKTAASLGMPEHLVYTLLDSLADLHLLQAGAFFCYRYDPLVKLYARRQALLLKEDAATRRECETPAEFSRV